MHEGKPVFGKIFLQVLKFHAPGLAPVQDQTGWYHLTAAGAALYPERYVRTFGYYFNCAAVQDQHGYFHLDEHGSPVYTSRYAWCGNYQEAVCVVRDTGGLYKYIGLQGELLFDQHFSYAGDFRDGYACVKTAAGWTHRSKTGEPLYPHFFSGLGVFHKGYATARDEQGWFHIDLAGKAIYAHRFQLLEPFYNGIALAHNEAGEALLVDEMGRVSGL